MSWLGLLDVAVASGVVCLLEDVRRLVRVWGPIPLRRTLRGRTDLLRQLPPTGRCGLVQTAGRWA
jgi:hypothetical protein